VDAPFQAKIEMSYRSRPQFRLIPELAGEPFDASLPTEEKTPPEDIEWSFTRPSGSISKVVISGLQEYTALEEDEKKIY
jgi:hypothetical protein